MKMFEDNRPPEDAAALLSALFREFYEVPSGVPSQTISPSGLACQVACALKLQGIPTEPQKESFQSRGFTDCGEDRHKRIQEFLSQTPYWVNVGEYVKKKKLDLDVIRDDGYETLLQHKTLPIRFKCDGMLLIEGIYYVLEIKTERGQVNAFRTSYDPKHQKQGITYTLMLHTDRILWVYEGREMLEQKPFVQIVTKQEKADMQKYLQEIVDNKDHIEFLKNDEKSCAYCPYKKYCKAYFKEYKKKQKEANNGNS